jgi:hypothetical protein
MTRGAHDISQWSVEISSLTEDNVGIRAGGRELTARMMLGRSTVGLLIAIRDETRNVKVGG